MADTRFDPPSESENYVCARIRIARRRARYSQRALADEVGLSRNQLNRIERGDVAPRFRSTWDLCAFLDLNPFWLLYGDDVQRQGFVDMSGLDELDDSWPFLETFWSLAEPYKEIREQRLAVAASPSILSNSRSVEKNLGRSEIASSLIPEMPAEPRNWDELRAILVACTETREAKRALQKHCGVSLAAVSQWRSNTAKPNADKTVKILAWLRDQRLTTTKKNAPVKSGNSRPARKNRKDKSTNEKSKSDPARQ